MGLVPPCQHGCLPGTVSLGAVAGADAGTDSGTQRLAVVCQLPEDVSVDFSEGCGWYWWKAL